MAQSLARCDAGPRGRIDLPHDVEQALGIFLAAEVTHVQTETFASVFAPARYEERETAQFRMRGLRQRDWGGRCRQVDDEGAIGYRQR
jgi:hypothetical protein